VADSPSSRLAVLIDADNAQAAFIDDLLAEVAKYGVATVKRIYGDWTSPQLGRWKDVLHLHAINPVQQFAYTKGKNATDSAMIIDAMDLLYTGRFDGFCLVTSDSDFTRLASRLRESGVTVFGFGERKTPAPFVAACDRFVYVDVLSSPGEEAEKSSPTVPSRPSAKELRGDTRLMNLMRKAIESASDDDGWAPLSVVGNHIAKQAPDFDPRNWRYAKLVDLVTAIGTFEVQRDGKTVRVREKKTPGRR
jgi:uncharacterized LabA/DUF88 family protein